VRAQSRRQFIKYCFYTALAGIGGAFIIRTARKEAFSEAGRKLKPNPGFEPAYLKLHKSGELKERADRLWKMMESCRLCPRECGVNRLAGAEGFCRASARLEIASFQPHFGEEKPLVGSGGSGTIFFTNCGLRCVFCINWEISQAGRGSARTVEDMAEMMLALQEKGCLNINVVTPTHYSPHILLALDQAAGKGLTLPLVYNTCGWERPEILKMLDRVVDIYLPDFKYSDPSMAVKYSDGLIRRGLMIRHLVMPNRVGGTKEIVEWIAENLPKDTYLNIMSQYTPTYKASEYPAINRRIIRREYAEAVGWAESAGLTNIEIQGSPLI